VRERGRGLGMKIRHVVLAAWYRIPDLVQLKLQLSNPVLQGTHVVLLGVM